ncbi:unnamed protein product, partial [Pylaiella littoralis]
NFPAIFDSSRVSSQTRGSIIVGVGGAFCAPPIAAELEGALPCGPGSWWSAPRPFFQPQRAFTGQGVNGSYGFPLLWGPRPYAGTTRLSGGIISAPRYAIQEMTR